MSACGWAVSSIPTKGRRPGGSEVMVRAWEADAEGGWREKWETQHPAGGARGSRLMAGPQAVQDGRL